MANKIMTNEQMLDNIALLREKGLEFAQIASLVGASESTCKNAIRALVAAQEHDADTLRRITLTSKKLVVWACKKCGYDYEAPFKLTEAKQEVKDNTAQAFATLVDAIKELTKAVDAIDKRLSAMQLTQQGFRGDMQQQIAKVVEAVHVEGDILTKEHTKMVELLGSIKSNTKR